MHDMLLLAADVQCRQVFAAVPGCGVFPWNPMETLNRRVQAAQRRLQDRWRHLRLSCQQHVLQSDAMASMASGCELHWGCHML